MAADHPSQRLGCCWNVFAHRTDNSLMTPVLIVVIILALVFDFLNGVHDSSNVVATMISSRALSPRAALWMTALANFAGPFIFGVAVANTIGHEVVAADSISDTVLVAALVSAIAW